MNRIIDFIVKLSPKKSLLIFERPLGRWNIDYCKKKMGRKIDLANEDNCGTCGEYMVSQRDAAALKQKDNMLQ